MFYPLIAQTTAAATQAPQGPLGAVSSFLPMILIFVVFYFLLIRPQQKQQKQIKKMIADTKRGDEVILNSGLYGKVAEIKDNTVMLQVGNNVTLKFDRNAIQQVLGYELKK